MGLNDEREKAKQAIEWLTISSVYGDKYKSAMEYVLALATEVQELRTEVQRLREDREWDRWH